jgi:hypothetical protein
MYCFAIKQSAHLNSLTKNLVRMEKVYLILLKRIASVFIIAIFFSAPLLLQAQSFSQSFINTSRTGGGNFVAGDILELRTSIVVPIGTDMYNTRVNVPIPSSTIYIPGSLKITSNEADITDYSGTPIPGAGAFTDQKGDDRADTVLTGGVVTSVKFRLGLDVTNGTAEATFAERTSTGGRLAGAVSLPRFYSASTIIIASVRVQINLGTPLGTIIGIGSTTTYKATNGGADIVYTISSSSNTSKYITLQTGTNQSVCSQGRGVNLFNNYTNGTFGSGNTQNGPVPSPLPSFIYTAISGATPIDGYVSVVNNTSADGSTGKVFNAWDIFGDHTGTNTAAGNAATVAGSTGGYALIVNADYPPSTVATQTITGLCPNTLYNFEAWFRNICPSCGADPANMLNQTRPGVPPNINFLLNGNDYYTTGDLIYGAGTGNKWVKRGFTFTTGAGQTAVTFAIRNNANGGGGNDWVLDDVAISVCGPVTTISPTSTYCIGTNVVLQAKLSADPQYVFYQWQVSTDNGITWTNLTGTGNNGNTGSASSTVFYNIGVVNSSMNNYQYRIAVATSAANLVVPNGGTGLLTCAVVASDTLLVANTSGCLLPLSLGDFTAKLIQNDVQLNWNTFNEINTSYFDIQRSYDGTNFTSAGNMPASGNSGNQKSYAFTDNAVLKGSVIYYKIVTYDLNGQFSSGKIVSVNTKQLINSVHVYPNPARDYVHIDFAALKETFAITIIDNSGKVVSQTNFTTLAQNQVFKFIRGNLSNGVYFIRIRDTENGRAFSFPVTFQ